MAPDALPSLAWFLPLLLACGCAIGPRPVVCPARGGPAWRESRSAHFDVFSDASPGRVADLVAQLEELRAQLLVGMAGEGAEVPGRVRVLALDDPRAFRELAGDRIAGYFGQFGFDERPTVVIPTEWGGGEPESVAHELAHHLSRYFYPRQPPWFAEGLAEFYQSVASRDPNAHGKVGSVDKARSYWLAHTPRLDPRTLLTASAYPLDGHPTQFHLSSWLLFHWLWNERSAGFTAYQERLSRLEPPAQAWLEAFPDLDPGNDAAMAGLARHLEVYRTRGNIVTWKVEAPFDTKVEVVLEVPSADVHELLRAARRNQGASRAEQDRRDRAELEEQLREDPLHPEALSDLAEREKRSAAAELRRSVMARPDDWRGWYWLAKALDLEAAAPEERTAAEPTMRRALALAPDEPLLLDDLAWRLALDGRSGEALPLARRAVELVPWNGAFLDTLSYVYADLGRCREARALQERAASLLRGSRPARQRLAVSSALCSACAAPPGATAEGHPCDPADAVLAGVMPGDPPVGAAPGVEPLLQVVRSRSGPLQACYQAALGRNPKLAGMVTLRFSIQPAGTLDRVVVVEDQLGGSGVADCVRARVGAWRTPFRPSGEVTVEFPFNFTPAPPR